MKILVVAETKEGKLKKATKEILGQCSGKEVAALVFGSQSNEAAEELVSSGVATCYWVKDASFDNYHLAYAEALQSALEKSQAKMVFGSSSGMGKDLLARVAARKDACLVGDVVAIEWDGELPKMRRPFFSGKATAQVQFESNDFYFAHFRPNSFPEGQVSSEKGSIEELKVDYDFSAAPVQFVEKTKAQSNRPDLTEASVIVSGGRSLKSEENFKIIYDCADAFGGAPGASRAACDEGLAPHDMQVGQTGKTVNPSLYVACGISGAIQHLAGMRTSKVIVAINKDENAPIFSKANYGIVDDLFDIVPALTEKAKTLLSK